MTGGIRLISANPLSVLAIVLLIGLVLLLIPLLVLGIIGAAFMRLGLSWVSAVAIVLLMFAGSIVNIPVFRIKRDIVRYTTVDTSGFGPGSSFPSPVWETRISVNLGGAIIPLCIAAYLVFQVVAVTAREYLASVAMCTIVVLAITYVFTQEIAGIGIRVPFLIPALTALLAAFLLSGGIGLTAAVTAVAGGVFGTISGGNLAHLLRVRELEVPGVSIGGYGTFGSIFLCCVLPALIA